MPNSRQQRARLGQRLVTEFSGLRDALRTGQRVEQRYTVKTVRLDLRPRHYDSSSVRRLRLEIGVSQAIFARIVGASTDLVAAWEQGSRKPTAMACRLLETIERDKKEWIRRLRIALKTKTRAA